jgi:hypothetical protein
MAQNNSVDVRALTGTVACALTSSVDEEHFIAKNGEESVFSVLQKLLPQVHRGIEIKENCCPLMN